MKISLYKYGINCRSIMLFLLLWIYECFKFNVVCFVFGKVFLRNLCCRKLNEKVFWNSYVEFIDCNGFIVIVN